MSDFAKTQKYGAWPVKVSRTFRWYRGLRLWQVEAGPCWFADFFSRRAAERYVQEAFDA